MRLRIYQGGPFSTDRPSARTASQAESLCSDSELSVSVAESKQPLAVWNPRRFVREQAVTATEAPPHFGMPPVQQQQQQELALPSATSATVASVEHSEGAPA